MDLTHNIGQVRRAFDRLTASQIPFATAMALNDTAYDGLKAVQDEMQGAFDRPTRWTLNAFMVWRADKKTLMASIRERPSAGKRHYLKVQNTGGARPSTGLENLLRGRLRYAGQIVSVAPARGARLDGHGNWSAGERNQALSAVQAQRDSLANTTAASRKRKGKRAQYFVPRPGSKLSPGIWKRDGDSLTKVLHFSAGQANYRRRVNFLAAAERKTSQVYHRHFERRLAEAIRTAK